MKNARTTEARTPKINEFDSEINEKEFCPPWPYKNKPLKLKRKKVYLKY